MIKRRDRFLGDDFSCDKNTSDPTSLTFFSLFVEESLSKVGEGLGLDVELIVVLLVKSELRELGSELLVQEDTHWGSLML